MSLLAITLSGTQAAQNNALEGDYPAVIAALEHTAKLLKDEMKELAANEAGVVPIHFVTREQREIHAAHADCPDPAA